MAFKSGIQEFSPILWVKWIFIMIPWYRRPSPFMGVRSGDPCEWQNPWILTGLPVRLHSHPCSPASRGDRPLLAEWHRGCSESCHGCLWRWRRRCYCCRFPSHLRGSPAVPGDRPLPPPQAPPRLPLGEKMPPPSFTSLAFALCPSTRIFESVNPNFTNSVGFLYF